MTGSLKFPSHNIRSTYLEFTWKRDLFVWETFSY